MSFSTNGYVAIDTNVFGQLVGKGNSDKHINKLLSGLIDKNNFLLLDAYNKIFEEYERHLLNDKFMEMYAQTDEAYLTEYWIRYAPQKKIAIDATDNLAQGIRGIITGDEDTDRAFVYVAFKTSGNLISNDKKHILNRREKLLKLPEAKKSNIYASREAADYI